MDLVRTKGNSPTTGVLGGFTLDYAGAVLVENILPDVDERLRWGARSVVVFHLHHLLLNNVPKTLLPLLLQLDQLPLDLLVLLRVGGHGAGEALESHLLQDVVDLPVFAAQVRHHLRP